MWFEVNAKEERFGRFGLDPDWTASPTRMVLSKVARGHIWLAFVALACALPLSSEAQASHRDKPSAITDRWRWATPDQAVLQILALDARRQQVVVKVDNGDLTILKRGVAIPRLAVSLMAVSGSTAVFRSLSAPGREAVERINIALVNGKQVTTIARVAAPARSVTSGWVVVPQ